MYRPASFKTPSSTALRPQLVRVDGGTRARLAASAFDVLVHEGWDATSPRDIALHAGLPVASVLRVCRTRDDALRLVCTTQANAFVERLAGDDAAVPRQAVRRALEPALRDLQPASGRVRPRVADLLRDDTARAILVDGLFTCERSLDLLLGLRRSHGAVVPSAVALIHVLLAALARWAADGEDLDRAVDEQLALVFGG